MLSTYNYLDELLDIEGIMQKGKVRLTIIASELMEQLGYRNMDDFNTALLRSMEACTALHIPIHNNFRKFYKLQNDALVTDYYLSEMAAYLIAINGNPCNPNVAKAQLVFILDSKKMNNANI